ncbi:MAG: 16S rRNA processing protein RimM [Chloroflexi bacterium]|nr:16S rRNA processing protein RimM [Chloroflexota bacterium]
MDNPEAIVVGRVLRTHGHTGAVRVKMLSAVPHRFSPGETLQIDSNAYEIATSNQIGADFVLLTFLEIDTQSAAQPLVDQWITVPETDTPELPEGEYFHYQLLGLRVFTTEGEELGELSEILETGSNDVYVVSGGAKEILIPAISDVVRQVQLAEKRMVVELPDGLQ